jgi:hypothetical protein
MFSVFTFGQLVEMVELDWHFALEHFSFLLNSFACSPYPSCELCQHRLYRSF